MPQINPERTARTRSMMCMLYYECSKHPPESYPGSSSPTINFRLGSVWLRCKGLSCDHYDGRYITGVIDYVANCRVPANGVSSCSADGCQVRVAVRAKLANYAARITTRPTRTQGCRGVSGIGKCDLPRHLQTYILRCVFRKADK